MSDKLSVVHAENKALIPIGELSPNAVLRGFEESQTYLIGMPGEGYSLFADDAPLAMDVHRRHWIWSPGFFSGEVLLELEDQYGRVVAHYRADVSAAEHKSGRQQFLEYIQEIVEYAPELVSGVEPSQHALGGRAGGQSSVWIRYARLKCFIEPFMDSLRHVCDTPMQWNSYRRELLPAHLTRKVDVQTLSQLVANPELFSALQNRQKLKDNSKPIDDRLDVPFYQTTLDHPATRLIAQQLRDVIRLISWMINEFSTMSILTSETETDIAARIPRRLAYLQVLKKQLVKISRRRPFSEVSDKDAGIAGINAIAGNPTYTRAYRLGIRLLRDGISEIQHDERQYVPTTWQIYESWCFVSLAKALEQLLPSFHWIKRGGVSSAGLFSEGYRGDERLRLYTQLVCPSLERENKLGYYSISQERRPDLVLEYSDRERVRFICLDSKYTASKSGLLSSMTSAHVYRDAVKRSGMGPEYSVLLAPTTTAALLLSKPHYIANYRVGCLEHRSNDDARSIVSRVLSWFSLSDGQIGAQIPEIVESTV